MDNNARKLSNTSYIILALEVSFKGCTIMYAKKISSHSDTGKKIVDLARKKKEDKKQASRTIFGFLFDNVSYILQTSVWAVSTVIGYVSPKKSSAIKLPLIENKESILVKRLEEKKRIELFKLQNETKQFLEQLKLQPNLLFSFFSATMVTMPARLCTHSLLDTYSVFDVRSSDFSSTLIIISISQILRYLMRNFISGLVNGIIAPEFKIIDPFDLKANVKDEDIDNSINELKKIIINSKRFHYASHIATIFGSMTIMWGAFEAVLYADKGLFYQSLETFHDLFLIGLKNTAKYWFNHFRNSNQDLSSRRINDFSKQLKQFELETNSFKLKDEDNAFNQYIPSNNVNEHVFQASSLLSQHLLLTVNSETNVNNLIYFLKSYGLCIELISDEYMVVKRIKSKSYHLEEMIGQFNAREEALYKLEKLYPVVEDVCARFFQSNRQYKLYIQNDSTDPTIKLIASENNSEKQNQMKDFFLENFKNVFCCIISGKLQIEFNSESDWLGKTGSLSVAKWKIKKLNSLENQIIENKIVRNEIFLISEKDNKSYQHETTETKKERIKTKGIPFLNSIGNNNVYIDLRKNKQSVAPPEDYSHYKVEADGKTFYTKAKYFTYFSSDARQVTLIVDAEELKRKKKNRAYFKNTFKRNFTRNNLRIANNQNDKGVKKLSQEEAGNNFRTTNDCWKLKLLDDKSVCGKTYEKVFFTPAKKNDKNEFLTFAEKKTEHKDVVIFNSMMKH